MEKQVEYDWVVKPGGNPADVRRRLRAAVLHLFGRQLSEYLYDIALDGSGAVYVAGMGGGDWTAYQGYQEYFAGGAPDTGSYNWTVPLIVSNNCLVKVEHAALPAQDQSNGVFTIVPPTITLNWPNGGESLNAGSSISVSWTYTGAIPQLNLYYSTDNGSSWNSVVSSTTNTGSYNWTIPDTPSDNCLVRISDTAGPASDQSDAVFSITGIPPAVLFETGVVTGVANSWQTVTLQNTYTSMVVVCSSDLGTTGLPAVCRVRNASDSSFEVMVQNPSGNDLTGYDVH